MLPPTVLGFYLLLAFIRKLHDELAILVNYVSHSLQEVLQITDTMVLMKDGHNIASGPITEKICFTGAGNIGLVCYLFSTNHTN